MTGPQYNPIAAARGAFGWALRCWRLERGFTIRQAADLLACSAPFVVEMERGSRAPSGRICTALERAGLRDASGCALADRLLRVIAGSRRVSRAQR